MLACFFAQIHTGCIFLECLRFVTGFRTALIKSNFDIRAALDTLVEITACFTEKEFLNVKYVHMYKKSYARKNCQNPIY